MRTLLPLICIFRFHCWCFDSLRLSFLCSRDFTSRFPLCHGQLVAFRFRDCFKSEAYYLQVYRLWLRLCRCYPIVSQCGKMVVGPTMVYPVWAPSLTLYGLPSESRSLFVRYTFGLAFSRYSALYSASILHLCSCIIYLFYIKPWPFLSKNSVCFLFLI